MLALLPSEKTAMTKWGGCVPREESDVGRGGRGVVVSAEGNDEREGMGRGGIVDVRKN